ncbi:2'-5' RNA ligase family protein [Virgisporangium aurantiacum]|uniref:2'-5' RNA ligase n=1 Tax=Virgisporangium aurantiacum TaxID=175570 RepID=A0A8J3ZG78_9ACTN|nr:2'-5' RNA ligase family protein [Virgisporangium aurantiacum]GIJ62317.1 hypothetical protein Vau01_098330 [Virgisporangium aurantiacum]
MTSRELRSLRDRWTSYERLPTLSPHWYWRPGWRPGRTFYTWHLTFVGQATLHGLVADLQRSLRGPELDPVPPDGLHLTLQGVGFTDEVDTERITAVRRAAVKRCARLTPFDLTLGPVDPDPEGVGLLVRPWDAVERLRHALRAATAAACGTVPEPADGFRPHVTIFYSGAPAAVHAVRERLRPLRDRPPVDVTVRHVSLIALRREERRYSWDTVADVRLGG